MSLLSHLPRVVAVCCLVWVWGLMCPRSTQAASKDEKTGQEPLLHKAQDLEVQRQKKRHFVSLSRGGVLCLVTCEEEDKVDEDLGRIPEDGEDTLAGKELKRSTTRPWRFSAWGAFLLNLFTPSVGSFIQGDNLSGAIQLGTIILGVGLLLAPEIAGPSLLGMADFMVITGAILLLIGRIWGLVSPFVFDAQLAAK